MAISPSLFLGSEILRDGGSLAALCQCSDSCEYRLVFPINTKENGVCPYLDPVLINVTTSLEFEISWQDANAILSSIRAIALNDSQKVLDLMDEAVVFKTQNT